MGFISNNYLLWKSCHIIAIVSWMAALLYLPRLFVYHCQVNINGEQSTLFSVMEYKLLRFIATPAMIATYLFGILLIMTYGHSIFHSVWFSLKLVLVLILSGFHGFCAKQVKQFNQKNNHYSETFFRIINEIPAVILIVIVFLVVMKPFSG